MTFVKIAKVSMLCAGLLACSEKKPSQPTPKVPIVHKTYSSSVLQYDSLKIPHELVLSPDTFQNILNSLPAILLPDTIKYINQQQALVLFNPELARLYPWLGLDSFSTYNIIDTIKSVDVVQKKVFSLATSQQTSFYVYDILAQSSNNSLRIDKCRAESLSFHAIDSLVNQEYDSMRVILNVIKYSLEE